MKNQDYKTDAPKMDVLGIRRMTRLGRNLGTIQYTLGKFVQYTGLLGGISSVVKDDNYINALIGLPFYIGGSYFSGHARDRMRDFQRVEEMVEKE